MLLVGLLLAVVVFVSLACLVAFLLAGRLSRLLGLTGNIVLSRLLGVLLAALAVPCRAMRYSGLRKTSC